jgi:hypothetical protein
MPWQARTFGSSNFQKRDLGLKSGGQSLTSTATADEVEQMGLELDLFLSMNSESPGKI